MTQTDVSSRKRNTVPSFCETTQALKAALLI